RSILKRSAKSSPGSIHHPRRPSGAAHRAGARDFERAPEYTSEFSAPGSATLTGPTSQDAALEAHRRAMTDDRSTIEGTLETAGQGGKGAAEEVPCLVVCWSREEPQRVGEIGFVGGEIILGRGGARPDDGAPRLALGRQRPGSFTLTGPIGSLR